MNESREFRIPVKALRKQFAWQIAVVVGSSAAAVFITSISPVALVFGFAAVLLAILVVYPLSRRRVWVTTSPLGVQGRGSFGCKVRHSWVEPVLFAPALGRVAGVQVIALDKDGIPKSFASLFIPSAILLSPEFQAEVASNTTGKHPLKIETALVA